MYIHISIFIQINISLSDKELFARLFSLRGHLVLLLELQNNFFLISLESLGSFYLSIYHGFHIWHAAMANIYVISIE